MDSGGYKTRAFPEHEKNVGGTHGLYVIFFLLEHVTSVVPVLCFLPALFLTNLLGGGVMQLLSLTVAIPVIAVVAFALILVVLSHREYPDAPADWTKYIDIQDSKLAAQYKGKKIPIAVFVENYMNQKIEFVQDPIQVWWKRHEIFRFCFTIEHVKFFLLKFTGQLIHHSQSADTAEVRDVYDRSNEFYRCFLGPRMIYTTAIFEDQSESLEDAQDRKMDLVCRYSHMKPGDEHLDIGCGWGTLCCYAAKHYGTRSTGVTLAREQVKWAYDQAESIYGVKDNVEFLCMDYRDIPKKTYNVITSLEMAEHVGIKNFQSYLLQIKDMLTDDGIFYLQLAGLRRAWQFEDLCWGVFMGTYIFPAADASCPLGFTVTQAERAGYEVHRVENCGVHYSLTINHWLNNWISNKDKVIELFGEWWYRCWIVFLGWSTIVASQGSSTVFLITLHKNTTKFERRDTFIGKYPIATQQ